MCVATHRQSSCGVESWNMVVSDAWHAVARVNHVQLLPVVLCAMPHLCFNVNDIANMTGRRVALLHAGLMTKAGIFDFTDDTSCCLGWR